MIDRIIKCFCTALVLFCAASSLSANPDPPSWSSFDGADFSGIYMSPAYSTGDVLYTLSLGSHPTIKLGGISYQVKCVQAFFVVSQDNTKGFTIT